MSRMQIAKFLSLVIVTSTVSTAQAVMRPSQYNVVGVMSSQKQKATSPECMAQMQPAVLGQVIPVKNLDPNKGLGYKRFVTGHYPADPAERAEYVTQAEAIGFIDWYIGIAVARDINEARKLMLQYAEGYKLEKGERNTKSYISAYNPLPSDILILIANPDEIIQTNPDYDENDAKKGGKFKVNEAAYARDLKSARLIRFPFNKEFTALSDKPEDISLSDRSRFNTKEMRLVIDTKGGGIPIVRMAGLAHPDPRGALNVNDFLTSQTGKSLISKLRSHTDASGSHEVRISSNLEAVLEQLQQQERKGQGADMNRYANPALRDVTRAGFAAGHVFTIEFWTKFWTPKGEKARLVGGVLGKITADRAIMIETIFHENRTQLVGFKNLSDVEEYKLEVARINSTRPSSQARIHAGNFVFDKDTSYWISDAPYVREKYQTKGEFFYRLAKNGEILPWEDSIIFPKMAVAVVAKIAESLGVQDIDMGMVSNWTWALGTEYHQGDSVVASMFGFPHEIQMPAKGTLWIPSEAIPTIQAIPKVKAGPSVREQKEAAREADQDPMNQLLKKAERAAKNAQKAETNAADAAVYAQKAIDAAVEAAKLAASAPSEKKAAALASAQLVEQFAQAARNAAASK